MSRVKYGAEAHEKAYELMMVQHLPFTDVIRKMREQYTTFSKGTLTKWKNSPKMDWEGRYQKYCDKLAEKSDKERLKKIKPIVEAIEEIRDGVYNQLVNALKSESTVITEKNIGLVLTAFARMGELEYKMKGGKRSYTPMKQVIGIIFMALEKNPNVGPIITSYKKEIEEAIFEEIQT